MGQSINKKDGWAALGLLALLFAYFPDVFFAKSASLTGDHYEQHFPWAAFLSQSLKAGHLPFWTNALQCGFPIAAEGQISIFYLPQLLLYWLLPLDWAYSYVLLLHLFIAGLGTYFYARVMRLDRPAAFIAAAVYLFGAGIGGAYYNITSLKTLCWLPVMLYSFESFLSAGKKLNVVWIAAAAALSILAGYLQVAFYGLSFFGVYVLLRLFLFPDTAKRWPEKFGVLIWLGFAMAAAFLLTLPQNFLTYQLSMFSNRLDLSEEYTYVGAMSPVAFMTFIFPSLQPVLRANCLYIGIPAIVFLLSAFVNPASRKSQGVKLWFWLTLTAILLCLGKAGLLYPALIKLTHFYSFRIPSKFIIFACLGLSILCGFGFQALFANEKIFRENLRKLHKPYLFFTGLLMAAYAAANLFLTLGRKWATVLGEWLVERFIYGKPGHPYSMDTYRENLQSVINVAVAHISPFYFWNLLAIGLVIATHLIFFSPLFSKKSPRFIMLAAGLLLAVDLGFYSVWDLRADFRSYADIRTPNAVIEKIEEEKAAGNLGRIHGLRPVAKALPLIPSTNMLYGVEDIGIYSPLVMKRYHDSIGLLGDTNDSNWRHTPANAYVLERLPLLNFLNVSHLLSSEALEHPALELIESEDQFDSHLYRNSQPRALAYFISHIEAFETWEKLKDRLMTAGFNPAEILLLEKTELNKISFTASLPSGTHAEVAGINRGHERSEWTVKNDGPGFFVISDLDFPGWKAEIDGKPAPVLKAHGLFKAVWIDAPGEHTVKFSFKPFSREQA